MVVEPDEFPSRVDLLPLKVQLIGVTTSGPDPPLPVETEPPLAPEPLREPPFPPVSTGLTPAHPSPAATANDPKSENVRTDVRLGETRERIGLLRRLGT